MDHEPPAPFDTVGDEPVEARIVAWVLGEASAFEAAELERLCEERPELLVFRRRMRALHGLLTEVEASEADHSWKLPPEKRMLLDEICGQERTVRLEAEQEHRIQRSGRRAWLAIAACVMLGVVVMQLIPRKYESKVTLEVKPRSSGISPLAESGMKPQFFGTEFEKIKSNSSLEKVVDNLDLADRWKVDKQTAVKRLKENITTENVRGTALIDILVRDAKKQDADEIAMEVTKAYKEYRSEIENRESTKALFELNKAVRDQEDKVEERRKVLATIVRTKGIMYKGQDSFYGQSGVDEDQAARGALQTYNELQAQKMQLESQAQSLLKYDSDDLLRYASGLDLPENSIKQNYPQYLQSKREISDLKIKGLADNHPTLEAARENITAMKRQLDEGVINLKDTLNTQLAMASERLEKVKALKDDTHEDAIKRGLDAQDYADAKRDFETDQELLQQLKLKQIGETISSKMSDESIAIVESPSSFSTTSRSAVPAPAAAPAPVAETAPVMPGKVDYQLKSGRASQIAQAEAKESARQGQLATASAKRLTTAAQRGLASNGKSPAELDKIPLVGDIPAVGRLFADSEVMKKGKPSELSEGAADLGQIVDNDSRAAGEKSLQEGLDGRASGAGRKAKANEDRAGVILNDGSVYSGATATSAGALAFDAENQKSRERENKGDKSVVLGTALSGQQFRDQSQFTPSSGVGQGLGGGVKGSAVDSQSAASIPNLSLADRASKIEGNERTAGLRSGDQPINRNNIDAILNSESAATGGAPLA